MIREFLFDCRFDLIARNCNLPAILQGRIERVFASRNYMGDENAKISKMVTEE
jgi:hypothetical protein